MRWDVNEVATLKTLWATSTMAALLQHFPGRSAQHLREKASRLGLRRDAAVNLSERRVLAAKARVGLLAKPMWNAFWTPARIAVLRAHYSDMSTAGLVKMIPGATAQSVYVQANRLGLHRDPKQVRASRQRSINLATRSRDGKPAHNRLPREQRPCASCGATMEIVVGSYRENRRFCSRRCVLNFRGPSSLESAVAAVLTVLGETFLPQHPIGPFHADFYLPTRNLVIEVDGAFWHDHEAGQRRDRQRDGYMWKHGYRVLRLREEHVLADARAAVADVLKEAV